AAATEDVGHLLRCEPDLECVGRGQVVGDTEGIGHDVPPRMRSAMARARRACGAYGSSSHSSHGVRQDGPCAHSSAPTVSSQSARARPTPGCMVATHLAMFLSSRSRTIVPSHSAITSCPPLSYA